MSSTQAIQSRLHALRPNLQEIMKIGSTPGAAIAVIHNGELIYQENLGYRDLEKKLPVTEETIFPCASLTKAVVAAALGICVDEEIGGLKWDSKVHDVLPEWTSADEILKKEMTVTDCLSHRVGMEAPDHWLGSNNNILIPQEKSLDFLNALQRTFPFRDSYGYNNCGYELAGHILTKAASQRWDAFVKTRILDPLNMTRTSTHAASPSDPNFATGYWALDADPSNPAKIVPVSCSGETFMGAAAAMHSCTADLVKLYSAFLDSAADQYASSSTSTSGSPLKQVPALFSPHINMNPKLLREQSYALGWARLQMPGPMDQLRPQKNRPDVGKGVPSELVLYHQGSFPGALAFVALVPESKGCVLVLTNGLSMSVNGADLMGQALLEGYLGVADGEKNDYVEFARNEKEEKDKSWYEDINKWLDENRTGGDSTRELEDYVGDYWDEAKTLMIRVFIDENKSPSDDSEKIRKLKMAFAGMESEEHDLMHYQNDEFTWFKARDEFSKRGLWARHKENYVIGFWEGDGSEAKAEDKEQGGKDIKSGEKSKQNKIEYLTWWYNKESPRPKKFYKET